MVDEAPAHERDRLEPAVRMLWEAGHGEAVVHPPAVDTREVHAEVARRERGGRTHLLVPLRVPVEVVHAEQERIGGGPLEAERDALQHRIVHVFQRTAGGTGPGSPVGNLRR